MIWLGIMKLWPKITNERDSWAHAYFHFHRRFYLESSGTFFCRLIRNSTTGSWNSSRVVWPKAPSWSVEAKGWAERGFSSSPRCFPMSLTTCGSPRRRYHIDFNSSHIFLGMVSRAFLVDNIRGLVLCILYTLYNSNKHGYENPQFQERS